MLTSAEFAQLLAATAQPVTWTQAKAPHATANVRAIVASTAKAQENIANAYGVNGRSFQFAANALPVPPEKFDVITDAEGNRYVLDAVVVHQARGTGAITSHTCFAKGR
jgi:hypothetical protein